MLFAYFVTTLLATVALGTMLAYDVGKESWWASRDIKDIAFAWEMMPVAVPAVIAAVMAVFVVAAAHLWPLLGPLIVVRRLVKGPVK